MRKQDISVKLICKSVFYNVLKLHEQFLINYHHCCKLYALIFFMMMIINSNFFVWLFSLLNILLHMIRNT